MHRLSRRSPGTPQVRAVAGSFLLLALSLALLTVRAELPAAPPPPPPDGKGDYADMVQPLLKKYCLECHAAKVRKGGLDLERFASLDLVRKDLKPWQQLIEMLEAGEMPPKSKPQPTAEERRRLVAWTRGFLDAEARAHAGDPGHVPLRRLSNAEYDRTIRALTGVDLRPTREFPVDGAAGEGFTNAAEALSDISPTLLNKYLNAAKDLSEHAVLLPDGFRFSSGKTRRDWTNESVEQLRAFYSEYAPDGRLPLQPYLMATIRHRADLLAGKTTPEEVARREKLNPKYLAVLWRTLTDPTPSVPLDRIRAHWRQATEKDAAALTAEIVAWQTVLWKTVAIGSYRYGATERQQPNDPAATETPTLRLAVKPAPGQSEVVLHLAARDLAGDGKSGPVVWRRPRFEGAGKAPLLLRDYAQFGPGYEIDYAAVFADSACYLDAVAASVQDPKRSVEDLAATHKVDAVLLKRWMEVLALEPQVDATEPAKIGRPVPLVALALLDEKQPRNEKRPAINGWRRKGADLPVLVSNASEVPQQVPGKMAPYKVAVHPTPKEFVAVAWKAPLAGTFRVTVGVAHVHPDCGNGVAWWLEHRRGDKAVVLSDGVLDLGGTAHPPVRTLTLDKDDLLVLAVDPRNGDHTCDLTRIDLTVVEKAEPGRKWDLAADVADSVLDGNPHADKHGNKEVWSFVAGPSRPTVGQPGVAIPAGSVLDRWREAVVDPKRQAEAVQLAKQVQTLLSGARPADPKSSDRLLYDRLASVDSPLFQGVDPTRLARTKPGAGGFGLAKERFGRSTEEDASLFTTESVLTVRLPAALFRDREFVVEAKADGEATDRVMQFQVLTAPPVADSPWDGKSAVAASPNSPAYHRLLQGCADFRRTFPMFVCFTHVIPTDEVVCLKMYHREDEPLRRLFLDAEQTARLDRLWVEQRFISQQPVAENKYLPLFIGFVTQDQPKELLAYFESQREPFRKRAEDFEKEQEAAVPKQLDALFDFAARAYRRPLQEKEKGELLGLYQSLRKKDVAHEEAFRGVLTRILLAPAFLFRIEQAPPGKEPASVNDWELASRLSYFLWAAPPDEELRRLAAAGRLHEPQVLAEQTRRLLRDERVRGLAIEFGTQWIHVRGFDELNEKNEKLFPTFDVALRQAIYEESVLFFQDLFQSDRAVTQILDADYTFLNETLARHYGIAGVVGPQWRRVDGVRAAGRGGILGLASVQARQAGASRTSPTLRGNWVVETLLGEKLPRPPANVPQLPDEEGGADHRTTRQQVEKHASAAECAVCHRRIDPFGFALEHYDPIGRRRDRDLGGLAVDARARLQDGTEFDGIDGLRTYLLTKKKDVIVRLFCRKLLGYALGRSVMLSDQPLINEMVAELDRNEGRLSAAVLVIVRSPQFRMIRGGDYPTDE